MPLTEGMKIISHRTSTERPEFHGATCEVFIQSTRRVEQMPLVFRYAADSTGTPCVYVHVAQLNRIMGFKNGAINGWIRERAKDGRSVGVFPTSVIKGLLTEKRGGRAQARGVSLEFIIAELSRVPDRDRNKVLSYLRRWLYVAQQGYLYPGSGHVGLPESVRELTPWGTKPSGASPFEPEAPKLWQVSEREESLEQEAADALKELSGRIATLAVKALQDANVPGNVALGLTRLRYDLQQLEENLQKEMKQ
jgi:hypothetical protein|nr:MAG TPA: hypothetical protein [Caudoviricetes sp.]